MSFEERYLVVWFDSFHTVLFVVQDQCSNINSSYLKQNTMSK